MFLEYEAFFLAGIITCAFYWSYSQMSLARGYQWKANLRMSVSRMPKATHVAMAIAEVCSYLGKTGFNWPSSQKGTEM